MNGTCSISKIFIFFVKEAHSVLKNFPINCPLKLNQFIMNSEVDFDMNEMCGKM